MSEPYICTAEAPWTPGKGTPAVHPDAVEVGKHDYGLGSYCVLYKCPHCGQRILVELPQ